VALPGIMSGRVDVQTLTRFFGAESNFRYCWWDSGAIMNRYTMLIGPRYLNLDQKLIINDSRQDLPGLGNPGNSFFFQDNFTTYTRFYGGQVGLEGECRIGCFVLTLTGKVAVGENDMISKISGNTIITEPDGTVTTSNTRAVLVQPSNV